VGLIERVCPPIGEQDDALDWPWWVPVGLVVTTVAAMVKALADRHALLSPGPETLLGILTVSPWLLELAAVQLIGRTLPRLLFAAVVIGGVTALLWEPTDYDFAPFLLVAMVVEVAVTASLRTSAAVTGAAMAALLTLDVLGRCDGVLTWVAGLAASGALGALLRSRMLLLERERAVAAGLAERAAVEERQRIAREVHDVIAHSLSVTMLHVTGTRHLLETEGDVDEAVLALRDAERLGRQAMTDIRRTVGLLGQVTEPTAPMPGLSDLEELIADFRSAGIDVDYRVRGDATPLSLATGLGLYRIVQESLANVAKHAPGTHADVLIDLTDDPLRTTIRNGPGGSGDWVSEAGSDHVGGDSTGGLGLPGMRQRAALLGGELRAGSDGDGWCVEVTVPRTIDAGAEGDTEVEGAEGEVDTP